MEQVGTKSGSLTVNESEPARLSLRDNMKPHLLQPSILLISLAYLMSEILSRFGITVYRPAERQFTYHCAILGIISSVVIYTRSTFGSNHQLKFDLTHCLSLSLIVILYAIYWTSEVALKTQGQPTGDPDVWSPANSAQDPLIGHCYDSSKCSSPLHLVTQSAFMLSVLFCLVLSVINVFVAL